MALTLTKAELRVMRALWTLRSATIGELLPTMGSPRPAHTSVSTVLGVLESKGVVKRDITRKAHVYQPIVDKSAAERVAIGDLLRNFFSNDRRSLALRLLAEDDLSPKQLVKIRSLLEDGKE
jgi:BlaI family transcriptional regulator, penicillinase repressor